MSWIFKGLVFSTLAVGGFYGLRATDTDRVVVERLMRAPDSGQRRADVLGSGSVERTRTEVISDAPRGHGTADPSKAFVVRGGLGETTTLAATESRLEGIAAGYVRMAQAPAGTGGPSGQRALQPNQPEKKPLVDDARRRLASSIQVELKRVGCYAGEVDGDWGQASQRAMKSFNDRVKATLPINQPDYILLTLLQGHTTMACGAAVCPRGEVDSGDGSCKPRAVVTENRLRSTPAEPAPWAQSLAQIAGADRGTPTGPAASEADIQRARLAAEQDRLRLKNEAEARLQETVRLAADARAKAETTRAEAAALAQRKADTERASADAERIRIAAAEDRRRQQTAEIDARAEADRLARFAEAEKARITAEANRREELDALAARTAETQSPPAMAKEQRSAARATDKAYLAGRSEAPARVANAERNASAAAPRFIARFVPPPMYRVGRLPPAPLVIARPAQRPVLRVFIAAPPPRGASIFNHVSRQAP